MVKYIIKSFFCLLGLFIIAVLYYGLTTALVQVGGESNIILFFVFIIIIMGLLTWLLSKILAFISYRNGFIYWLFAFGFSIYILVIGLKGEYHVGNNEFMGCMFSHLALTFFMIPQLNGSWETYLNRETTYYDGNAVSYREWVSDEYTPGWVQKLIAQAIISVIIAIIYCNTSYKSMWFIFAFEGGFCGILMLMNFKSMFFD